MSGLSARTIKTVFGNVLGARHLPFAASNSRFRVVMESPSPDLVCPEGIEIRGWAFAESGEAISGQVVLGDLSIPLKCDEHRVDVARTFSLGGSRSLVGFRKLIRWEEIDCGSNPYVDVHLEMTHQSSSAIVGPMRVYREPVSPSRSFLFRLERPANDEVFAGNIHVSGWALALDGQGVTGRIIVNDNIFEPLRCEVSRPDVIAVHGLEGVADSVGFSHQLAWEQFAPGTRSVSLQLELCHGHNLLSLGPFQIARADSPILKHQRGNYKSVWEGAAQDIQNAMATVAGTTDAEDFLHSGASTARTLREAIHISPNDVVLEIGCGIGRIGRFLAPVSRRWIGADISGTMLAFARENLKDIPNVELIELKDASLSAFDSESVDKVYCSTVFMHLDEWERFRYALEAFRVLKPGGMLYVDNINLGGDLGWAIFEETLAFDPAQRPPSISKPSTAEELKIYLERAGFRNVVLRPGYHYVSAFGKKP